MKKTTVTIATFAASILFSVNSYAGWSIEELSRKGFRFNNPPYELGEVNGVDGNSSMECFKGGESTDDESGFTPAKINKSWYLCGENSDGKLNGLTVIYINGDTKRNPEYHVVYIVDGRLAFPSLYLYKNDGDYSIGVEEGNISYLEYTTFWDSPEAAQYGLQGGYRNRPMFLELKKVYGDVIGDRQFLTDGANGQFDLKGLQDAFDRFMKSDLHIAPSAWDEYSNLKPLHTPPSQPLPPLMSANSPVSFRFHVVDKGGDYGMFETNSVIDFWEDNSVNGCDIACREYTTTVYENGRIYEYETIYYGRMDGNAIVFTNAMNSMENGPVEKITPVKMTASPDGKGLIFHDWHFIRR